MAPRHLIRYLVAVEILEEHHGRAPSTGDICAHMGLSQPATREACMTASGLGLLLPGTRTETHPSGAKTSNTYAITAAGDAVLSGRSHASY